jgi:hypothetical protein
MFHLLHLLGINKLMCLFQLFVVKLVLKSFFIESAGALRSLCYSRKIDFKTKAFHFIWGKNKRFEDLKIENFNPKQSLNFESLNI